MAEAARALEGERHDLTCPEPGCGAPMQLRPSRFGLFYGCSRFPSCRGTHGAHPNGAPLGVPADSATKRARTAAHAAFDRLWHTRKERHRAYRWLSQQLEIEFDACHIGGFDQETCARVVALCGSVKRHDVQRNGQPWS